MTQRRLSRRTFLRGAGATIALPFLDAMVPAFARAQATASPRRLICWYVPCGIHMASWTPAETGAGYALPPILAPLADVQGEVLVLTGLANRAAFPVGPADHPHGTGSFLTCMPIKRTDGADIQNGISLDQLVAQRIGAATTLPSLELGGEGGGSIGNCDSGYSCAYSRNIAWSGPKTPLAKETNPQVAFDRLFQGEDAALSAVERAARRQRRLSVLDAVRDDTARLRLALGPSDRHKIDEYLTGLRELERRLESSSAHACQQDEPAPAGDAPGHLDAMIEIMLTAFRCDLTRVITFMMANAATNRSHPWLGIPDSHHQLSHHRNQAANLTALEMIDRWEVEAFAKLLAGLHAAQEPDGSILDASIAFFSSELEDGDAHRHTNLPVLVAGRAGGAIAPGRHIRFATEEPIANLFLGFLHAFAIDVPGFGIDGTVPLSLG